ncbi:mucin-5AC [Patella vulgata]|uniref:mucin-5AC n=1 Tax=Patella vulgata TaxID=6465 RepID=UPI00217FCAC9|nr:mucin-5AC [Patella vulgata]
MLVISGVDALYWVLFIVLKMDTPKYNTDAAKRIPSAKNDGIITNKKRRPITGKLNDEQVKQLEEIFLQTLYPDNNMILNLSRKIQTNSCIIKKWFNSRRSKMMKSEILERVHVLPKVVTNSTCSYGTPKSRQKTVLVRIDSPPRDGVNQAPELLRHSENILCSPDNNLHSISGGTQWPPKSSYQESYHEIPTAGFQELPTSCEDLPITCYTELPRTYQEIPTTYYQEIPTTSYQEIPTSYQEIPTTSYQELPTTSYQELPTTSYQDGVYQTIPTTSYQELPTTIYQEILTTCYQDIPSTSYQDLGNDILEMSDYELNPEQRLYKSVGNAETISCSPDVTPSTECDILHCNTKHVLPNQITDSSTVSYIYQVGDDPHRFTNLSNQLADIPCQTTNISNQSSGQFANVSSSSNSPGNTNKISNVESSVHMSLNPVVNSSMTGKVNPAKTRQFCSIEDLKRLGTITRELTSETGVRVTNSPETQTVCYFDTPDNNNTRLTRTNKPNNSKRPSMRTVSTQTNYVEVENHTRSFATQTKPINKIKDISIPRTALARESSCAFNDSHMCAPVTPTIFPLLCIPITILPIENILQGGNKNLAPGTSIQTQCAAFHDGGCMGATWHPK